MPPFTALCSLIMSVCLQCTCREVDVAIASLRLQLWQYMHVCHPVRRTRQHTCIVIRAPYVHSHMHVSTHACEGFTSAVGVNAVVYAHAHAHTVVLGA